MVRQSGCTLSNIAIDYLVKNHFKVFMEFNNEMFMYGWIADNSSADLHLYASEPLSLLALYMIREEWKIKKEVQNYYKELIFGNEVDEFYKEKVVE